MSASVVVKSAVLEPKKGSEEGGDTVHLMILNDSTKMTLKYS